MIEMRMPLHTTATIAEALPLIAAGSVLAAMLARVVKRPTGRGLSAQAQTTHLVTYAAWLAYSLAENLAVSAIVSAAFLALSIVFSALAWRDEGRLRSDLLLPCVAAAALAAAGLAGGVLAVAVLLGLSPLAADAGQVRRLLGSDAPALSSVAYTANIVRAFAWIPYAVRHTDLAITLWLTSTITVSVAIVILLRARRKGSEEAASTTGAPKAPERT